MEWTALLSYTCPDYQDCQSLRWDPEELLLSPYRVFLLLNGVPTQYTGCPNNNFGVFKANTDTK